MTENKSGSTFFRWRASKLYPNASECVSTKIGIFHGNHWWHSTGPAREAYDNNTIAIRVQLSMLCTDRGDSIVHFNLYMIGRTADAATAVPTIMFFCPEKELRRQAKKTIVEGGILEQLPGFRTGHQTREPGVGTLIQPASTIRWTEQPCISAPNVYFDPTRPITAIGMPIFVECGDNHIRQATANVAFEGGDCVYISVLHVFNPKSSPTQSPAAANSDSEYDIGSGTEIEEDFDEAIITSCASVSSPGESLHSPLDWTSPESSATDRTTDGASFSPNFHRRQPSISSPVSNVQYNSVLRGSPAVAVIPPLEDLQYLGYMLRSCEDLDHAVIAIKNSKIQSIVYALKSNTLAERECTYRKGPAQDPSVFSTHTSAGVIPGSLVNGAASMRLPNSYTYQEVYQVRLDRPLAWGDCGAVIINDGTGEPYGFVVASSADRCLAYMIAASVVLESAVLQWHLPSVVDEGKKLDDLMKDVSEHRAASSCNQEHHTHNQSSYQTGRGSPISSMASASLPLDGSYDWDAWNTPPTTSQISKQKVKRSIGASPNPYDSAGLHTGPDSIIDTESCMQLKSKQFMITVRRSSMAAFLRREAEGSVRPKQQLRHESGIFRKPVVISRYPKQMLTLGKMQDKSIPASDEPKVSKPLTIVVPSTCMFAPIQADVERMWLESIVPDLRSIGGSLDPLGTMFQSSNARVSIANLKWHCIKHFSTYGLGKHWYPHVLARPHTLLSFLTVAAAHNDVISGRISESFETAALQHESIVMISENLLNPVITVSDYNIAAVVHLAMAETITRKEVNLAYHEAGLKAMIERRGGLGKLGLTGHLSSLASWVHLQSAILRGARPRDMYVGFCQTNSQLSTPMAATTAENPSYCPRGTFDTLQRSKKCSPMALDILNDMHTMIERLLLKRNMPSSCEPTAINDIFKRITQECVPISRLEKTRVLCEEDWKYEAIRLTSIILATAIYRRIPLSEAHNSIRPTRLASVLNASPSSSRCSNSIFSSSLEEKDTTPYTEFSMSPISSMEQSSPGIDANCSPFDVHSLAASSTQVLPNSSPQRVYSGPPGGPTALLRALKDALERSNLSDCWSDMAGVLLWIGLTVGAASRSSDSKILSQYFAATAMRASIMLCFDYPNVVHATHLRMTEVIEALSASPESAEEGTASKKRKT
ncbi:hypothetical protein T440DRAFT_205661 [Plenodomus tracheiphilus IPT5]|uniref:Uncharacterized protein n=1 Tax=Plenodomus tracheiphilus IPT5 TaxID=1408161 RepID=A0A6A7BL27_9PLEO|nr:hypothetical protein T440DRAFT_205661 [Plenodomus tracheiphilus IPT5]